MHTPEILLAAMVTTFVSWLALLCFENRQPFADNTPRQMARWVARENAERVWRKVKKGQ